MPGREWSQHVAVYIINPNSTESMTRAMTLAARAAVPELDWVGWTSTEGPPAIQGAEDGAAAAGPLLRVVRDAAAAGAQGVVVGCFDDTALDAAAGAMAGPVIGLGQAAFHHCALRSWRFSVVTTLSVSVPVIEGNIRAYGLGGFLGRVRASEVPVLALDSDPAAATTRIREEARAALAEDGVDAIVLGCAGMVNVIADLRRTLDCPVIDPVESAAGCLAWLLR